MRLSSFRMLRAGDVIHWSDPDDGACSQTFTIAAIQIAGSLCRCPATSIEAHTARTARLVGMFDKLVNWRRVEVPVQSLADMRAGSPGESSATIRARVSA